MWFDLILMLAALIPLFFTEPARIEDVPPAAR
jgi:hypothetical protein